MRVHNFSAGPSILPKQVIKEAAKGVINLNKSNLSILEISHRSQLFNDIITKAISLTKDILEIPDGYSVLFLQGGASLQFTMAPMNLMKKDNGHSAYLETGSWSSKAIKEANKYGTVDIVASSKDKNYNYIPKKYTIPKNIDYLHCTSNNTIFGTQMKSFPQTDVLVCDMSSDILSRKVDISKFSLIYAGAQKNLGPAGTTLVIIKDDILGKTSKDIPTMLDYRTHIKGKSLFNTPPVFCVYVCMLNLNYINSKGGINEVEKINLQKAKYLYEEIDNNPMIEATVKEKEDRSNMNVCFLINDKKAKEEFDIMCKKKGIIGINGHKSVGGYRASIYNALEMESLEVLVKIMRKLR